MSKKFKYFYFSVVTKSAVKFYFFSISVLFLSISLEHLSFVFVGHFKTVHLASKQDISSSRYDFQCEKVGNLQWISKTVKKKDFNLDFRTQRWKIKKKRNLSLNVRYESFIYRIEIIWDSIRHETERITVRSYVKITFQT